MRTGKHMLLCYYSHSRSPVEHTRSGMSSMANACPPLFWECPSRDRLHAASIGLPLIDDEFYDGPVSSIVPRESKQTDTLERKASNINFAVTNITGQPWLRLLSYRLSFHHPFAAKDSFSGATSTTTVCVPPSLLPKWVTQCWARAGKLTPSDIVHSIFAAS